MPFGIHKHSNRSKQALNDPAAQVQGTATPSSGNSEAELPIFAPSGTAPTTDEARATQPQAFIQQSRLEGQQYAAQSAAVSPADIDRRSYPNSGDFPARSQSTRHPSAYQQQQQPHQAQAGSSADDLVLDARKIQQQPRPNSVVVQPPVAEPKKSKNFFDRMRSNSSRTSDQKAAPASQGSYNNTTGLARRLSKRQENPPVIRTVQQRNSLEQQQRLDWKAAQDSRTHLPSPQEANEEDNGLDPYLIQPGQEGHPNSTQEQAPPQTIRPVQDDSEPLVYGTTDDGRQQFQSQQQHSHNQVQHQQSDSGSSNNYQLYHQSHSQQQLNLQPGSLIIGDPYRQQNPETVSQLSYDSPVEQRPVEQREEPRPISVQSNGQSPTGYTSNRQEYPNRTTSIQNPRPLSQYTAMAPPAGASQPNRRPTDQKQAMQVGQGQQESRDGPPPNYSRQQFPGNQPPTPGLTPGAQGPNYRGGPPQREQYAPPGTGEQGRSTPPPAPSEQDVNNAYKELCKFQLEDSQVQI
jgi:hypothetical protein